MCVQLCAVVCNVFIACAREKVAIRAEKRSPHPLGQELLR